jgi:UDP-glucuronate 4-epimerase
VGIQNSKFKTQNSVSESETAEMSDLMNKPILVTGAAGFIGFHLAKRLLDDGRRVVGIDNLNDYYDPTLKERRLVILDEYPRFEFTKLDLKSRAGVETLFSNYGFGVVVHLAAQAGVRYSIENPHAYIESNIVGHLHVLEGCRHEGVGHLVYASSSSVYGANTSMPFSVHDNVDHPVSLYAATKKSDELMSHTYSHLYGLPTTGLRFFEPIDVFNYGNHRRDFTYIDDIVEGVVRVMGRTPEGNPEWSGDQPDPATSKAPWKVYNIGNNQPIELMRYIEVIEECLGTKAEKNMLPMQPGDVPDTYADVDALVEDVDYKPDTPIEVGVKRFVDWYREFYGV